MSADKKLRIAFVHPDLGIGGAEQLVINLALGLQQCGHTIKIYTPHHDKDHCFEETRNGTLDVEVRGSIVPAQIFGRFKAFCAMIRTILASLYLILFGGKYDLVVVDQVSACVPILRLFNRKVLFYCHFPDKLLCVERRSLFKKFYRFFIDLFEEITTGCSNLVVVNSGFTKGIYKENFRLLNAFGSNPDILYPAIDFSKFDNNLHDEQLMKKLNNKPFFMSLNRYERKKGIGLSIEAFSQLKKDTKNLEHILVIAGGYDTRVTENVEHLKELQEIAKKNNLVEGQDIFFLCSVSDAERATLLKQCSAVLYTPVNEHFGIVPVESMYMEKPVVACNSGGPKESVLDGKTGFLLEPQPNAWAEKMKFIAENSSKAQQMGIEGKKNVIARFSFETFKNSTNEFANQVVFKNKRKSQ